MKKTEAIELIDKTQFQVSELVYGGVKTVISFTTKQAAKEYIGQNYKDLKNVIIIESVIKNVIAFEFEVL